MGGLNTRPYVVRYALEDILVPDYEEQDGIDKADPICQPFKPNNGVFIDGTLYNSNGSLWNGTGTPGPGTGAHVDWGLDSSGKIVAVVSGGNIEPQLFSDILTRTA